MLRWIVWTNPSSNRNRELDAWDSRLGASGQSAGQGLRRPDGIPDQKTEKRGNTPPASDHAGDRPASGAIVDPAGVPK
jgi:hypothetical protein